MAGRPPKPSALKLITGNPGKRAINSAEPEPKLVDNLEPPARLSPAVAETWREWAPVLRRNHVLTELDLPAFEKWCIAWTRFQKYNAETETAELIRNAETGSISLSPKTILRQMYGKACDEGESKFGMNPRDRSRVQIRPQGDLFGDASPQPNSTARFFK